MNLEIGEKRVIGYSRNEVIGMINGFQTNKNYPEMKSQALWT
jgi:hypothetical protein